MSTMITEVYDALISAGADEEKAKKAAEVLSNEKLATKQDTNVIQTDVKRLNILVTGLYIAGGATLGYIVSLLNTIIGKI